MTTSQFSRYDVLPTLAVDPEALRAEVRSKYRAVAETPDAQFHFHTGTPLARRLGYPETLMAAIPRASVDSFAGVANPIMAGPIAEGSKVVDVGSGGGFDTFAAAHLAGPTGQVIGIDMTPEMLERARTAAEDAEVRNVEFREGIAEWLPVDDGWADIVISNGVLNLVADKALALAEINRVLKPGGVLQFGDIANGKPVPDEAVRNIDLWAA
jgi:SAM-dependent methyltransferase